MSNNSDLTIKQMVLNKKKNSDFVEIDLPSTYADKLGVDYTATVNQNHKKKNGQFFTPLLIARFMASLTVFNGSFVRILDPGCGTAILSCALIEHLIKLNHSIINIELVAYETDKELLPYLIKSIVYLKGWLEKKQITFQYKLINKDFVIENAFYLDKNENLFNKKEKLFDIVICNPPYFKLSIDDRRAIAAKAVINGHPNIYAIFMAISANLLKENGEIILITPRSYASGNYFRVFRDFFFKIIQTERIHLFVSRKETFNRDSVLQETVILKGKKVQEVNTKKPIIISSSIGLKDLDNPLTKTLRLQDILDLDSSEKMLHLPTTDYEESILNIFRNWDGNLHKYNIEISTGPVVAFRANDYILDELDDKNNFAPLFWLHNVKQMILEWPIFKEKKGCYILVNEKTNPLLIPNKNYVFLRRFSSKDDKSRLIAAPYFCNFINSEVIGVENKLNYIYRPKGNLERNEIVGLSAILNCELFDTFFRIFNGNVNVSATELRDMPLPPYEDILEIGNRIILSNDFSLANISKITNEQFELSAVLYE